MSGSVLVKLSCPEMKFTPAGGNSAATAGNRPAVARDRQIDSAKNNRDFMIRLL